MQKRKVQVLMAVDFDAEVNDIWTTEIMKAAFERAEYMVYMANLVGQDTVSMAAHRVLEVVIDPVTEDTVGR